MARVDREMADDLLLPRATTGAAGENGDPRIKAAFRFQGAVRVPHRLIHPSPSPTWQHEQAGDSVRPVRLSYRM